jgi:ribosome-associated translation inhibitor RaiA
MGVAANLEPRNRRGRTDSPRTPVAIRARGIEVDAALDDYIHERCGFKLGKFAEAIDRISVRLEDVGGPKGAPSMRCAVKVVLSRHESIVVEVVEGDHRGAFDHAIDATARAVNRAREKGRVKARGRARAKA